MTGTPEHADEPRPRLAPWLAAALIVLLAAAIRVPLIALPLDRDEGGYAYGAQEILRGGATYVDFYTMRYPAIFGAYAVLINVFGESHHGIHLGLLFINAATAIFLYLAARNWFSPWPAVAAVAIFMAVSLNGTTEGFSANSEHFVILFASIGLWLLSRKPSESRARQAIQLASAGVAMGIAYLMKQHGIAFAVFGLIAVLVRPAPSWRLRAACAGAYAAGAALPVLLSWAHLYATGRFDAFWFWTMTYAREYAGDVTPALGLQIFRERFATVAPPILPIALLAAVGLYDVVRHQPRRLAAVLVTLLALSIAAVSIGFYFRPHYFRLLFPALAVFAAAGALHITRYRIPARWTRATAIALVAGACGFVLIHQSPLLFASTTFQAARQISGINPFPESLKIAEHIEAHTSPSDTIAVIGSEPQIYFYAKRSAATPHIYTYQLMEPHRFALDMQREMIAQIEAAAPAYVVTVDIPTSWLIRPDSQTLLLDWVDAYTAQHYEIAGRLDIVSSNETHVYWNERAQKSAPTSPYFISVYRRRE